MFFVGSSSQKSASVYFVKISSSFRLRFAATGIYKTSSFKTKFRNVSPSLNHLTPRLRQNHRRSGAASSGARKTINYPISSLNSEN